MEWVHRNDLNKWRLTHENCKINYKLKLSMDKIKKVLKLEFCVEKEIKTESNLNKMHTLFDPAIPLIKFIL